MNVQSMKSSFAFWEIIGSFSQVFCYYFHLLLPLIIYLMDKRTIHEEHSDCPPFAYIATYLPRSLW
jgi:hypothetical protein